MRQEGLDFLLPQQEWIPLIVSNSLESAGQNLPGTITQIRNHCN